MTVGEALAALDSSALHYESEIHQKPLLRLRFGNEFCETLLPTPSMLDRVAERAARAGAALILVTPMVSDDGIDRLRELLRRLPAGAEVVANDWGTLALLRREFPELAPVAGRLLCKMIKDPRLPGAEWARLYPHGIFSAPFRRVLERYGVRRVEIDVPPYATPGDLRCDGLALSVHVPYGYAAKGRICRIGSLHQDEADKFATGHRCRKECLSHVCAQSRPAEGARGDLPTFQRGTTIFYSHSAEMGEAVLASFSAGWIDEIVLSGDWNEDHGADQ